MANLAANTLLSPLHLCSTMISLRNAFHSLSDALKTLYPHDEADALAHETLLYITKLSKLQRLTASDKLLGDREFSSYQRIKSALKRGVPFQYATGIAHFYGRTFSVGPAVLIPRPETEELCAWILKENGQKQASVLDIGTGSGCIAITLYLESQALELTAIDLSEEALGNAFLNQENLNSKVQFQQVDFLDKAARNELPSFDIIVSNPPYIPLKDRETMHTNVKDNEPEMALFVPDEDPLIFYREIAVFGQNHLHEGGSIYCEMHRDYAEKVASIFQEMNFKNVVVREDMHGAPRMLKAEQ
ncbi:MAG: peptide chain release factor N(5)-glutamine methyltransferase [Chitinophagaceae bacterium]